MAYGILPAVADATKNFPVDLINSLLFPRHKITFGAEGSATDVSSAAPLPVTLGLTDAQLRAAALPVSLAGQSVGITGTVAISAGSLPLPTGAATSAAQTTGNASLASIDGKTPALVGGAVPVSVPTVATTTRAYTYANGVSVTAGATSARTAGGIVATEICVHNAGTVRAYIIQGNSAVAATVAATSMPIEPGEKMHLRHTSGDYVAAIRDGASDAVIRIMPVA